MMKKILSMLLAGLLLLSLFACGENITPTTDTPDDEPDVSVEEEDKGPKEGQVEYELGTLALLTNEEFEGKTNPIVMYIDTYEECRAITNDSLLSEIGAHYDDWPESYRKLYDYSTKKYTEAFFEEKQIILVVWREWVGGGNPKFKVNDLVAVTVEGQSPTYRLTVEFSDSGFGPDAEAMFTSVHTVEVEKSLGITPENLTVEVIDKTK